MARLNEPVGPTESIESLKRKFMRQNRDIARANSAQSLRIRNLENETSRLLAENLALHEQILHLQNELDNSRSQSVAESTRAIKSQLESKILELGALITGLGEEPPPKKKSPRAGKIIRNDQAQSPDQKNWKNMCTLSEAVGGQDGRLPPILENKQYPRRTLERQEIVTIASEAVDTTDSPEIGPPPVSQFVDEDPVKIDLPHRPRKSTCEELPDIDPKLSINLEQRKKRRESADAPEPRRASRFEPMVGTKDSTGSLKTGAKRKLSMRDDEEAQSLSKPPQSSPDDFKYTKTTEDQTMKTNQQPEANPKPTKERPIARATAREKETTSTSSRKVLAPKSVNASPKKTVVAKPPIEEDVKSSKADVPRVRQKEEQCVKKNDPLPIQPTCEPPIMDYIEVRMEPETPAGLDLFSPLSSQLSTARAESRDTPPPPDLEPGAEGQRPSRRARASVNYAQPNLRDKMRRPTKELIDAVASGDKPQRASIVKMEENTDNIKKEPEADDAWKSMPVATSAMAENSPLSGKTPASEPLPESITTHRKRRESIRHQIDARLPRSGSASSIQELLAESKKNRARAKERWGEDGKQAAEPKSDLEIYDFKSSSPPPGEEAPEKARTEEKMRPRVSKRQSTTARQTVAPNESERSDIGTSNKATTNSRRRQSSLDLRNSSVSGGHEEVQRALRKASSTIDTAQPGAGESRSDRIAARRRSMML